MRTPEERLFAKVAKTDSCWLWTGRTIRNGYGYLMINRRTMAAHRLAWELCGRTIAAGSMLCHICDVRLCVNPDHLFIGDAKANALDASRKLRLHLQKRTHCANGHLFLSPVEPGKRRRCRECQREYWRRDNEKRRLRLLAARARAVLCAS
jgi:hypothetical protein